MKRKIAFLLLIIIVLLTGIGVIVYKENRTFTLHSDVAECSFEVPLSFGPLSVEKVSENFTTLFGSYFFQRESSDYYLSGDVSTISDSYPNYKTLLEDHLKWAKQGQGEDEFNIVERSPITINGVKSEKVIYNIVAHHEATIIDNKIVIPKPTPRVSYEAFFQNEGILWHIEVDAIVEKTNKAKITFDHIIDTVTFLK